MEGVDLTALGVAGPLVAVLVYLLVRAEKRADAAEERRNKALEAVAAAKDENIATLREILTAGHTMTTAMNSLTEFVREQLAALPPSSSRKG